MSKRLSLREFQQGLIDRLQTSDVSGSRVTTLGVQIAGRNWLVDMSDIAEVLPLPPLTIVPFTKPWFRGMANIRGNLYGIIDMAGYEHSGMASGDINNRVLLLAAKHAINAGLLVDAVLGLRDAQAWRQSEGIDRQIEYYDENGAPWRKLDVHGLIEQAEFMQIGN
jgi:twitching motility protein PilI